MTPQIDCLLKTNPVLMVSTHIYGVSKEMDGKMFIFRVNPGIGTPQINYLQKMSPVWRVPTPIYGVSKQIDGKTIIFQLNLGM